MKCLIASSTRMPPMIAHSCDSRQDHRAIGFHYRADVPDRDRKHLDLASRIRFILKEMKWTKSQLARELGCEPSAVGNWLRRNRGMDASYAFILQDKYRWNARWIIEGVGPPRIEVLEEQGEELLQRIRELTPERRRALSLLIDPN